MNAVTADSGSEAAMAESNSLLSADSEYITLDATRRILHISKRKCAALLQNGTIPCTVSGKKTRQYRILREDVIALMKSPGKEKAKNPIGRDIPCIYTTLPEGFRERLDDYWSDVSDVLTQADLITITGYSQSAVSGWMMSEKLKTVTTHGTPVTSREWLIDFMCGEGMTIRRKSRKHLELLNLLFLFP